MKIMKRKLAPLSILFLAALLVVSSGAYAWRPQQSGETQKKLGSLQQTQEAFDLVAAQILQMEIQDLATRIDEMKQEYGSATKFLPEAIELYREWQSKVKEREALIAPDDGDQPDTVSVVNDTCSTATAITVGSKTILDTTMAANGTTIPTCDTSAFNDVWFSFAGDGNTHQVCTKGSNYDTVLQVYSGSCTGLTPVVCNDDGAGSCGAQSRVGFTAAMGVTYFIQVTDFFGGGGTLCIGMDDQAPDVTPDPVNFGAVHLGSTSATVNIALSQTGCGRVNYSSITEGGTDPGDFDETLPTTPFGEGTCDGNPTTFPASFTPTGPACGGARSATLTYVTDSGTVVQTLMGTAQNAAPVANAGPDQTVAENQLVTLMGSATDADAHDSAGPFSFTWTQTGGPAVMLSSSTAQNPTFTAPELPDAGCATLTFSLTVADLHGCPDATPDTVTINVGDTFVLADDKNGNCVVITRNCISGSSATYCWKKPDGSSVTGPCMITVTGNTANAQSTAQDPNVFQGVADLNPTRNRGNARLTETRINPRISSTIVDNNLSDSACTCP